MDTSIEKYSTVIANVWDESGEMKEVARSSRAHLSDVEMTGEEETRSDARVKFWRTFVGCGRVYGRALRGTPQSDLCALLGVGQMVGMV